ncbi:hypothetical protein F5Y08DRAFT_174448 [Xylaria arbuscula]|nr:hypothetical protein F5Y08DRAFT_174448 [Xylaria arbuscula]
MASTNNRQNKLWDRFKQHSGLPDEHLESFCKSLVAAEGYIQGMNNDMNDSDSDSSSEEDNSDENSDYLEATYYNADGSEFTLSEVPFRSLATEIEFHIQINIPEPRRTEVYKNVFEGFHGIRKTPRWDGQGDSPRAEPRTAFSESRAPPHRYRTNEMLFRKFASATKLDQETLDRIRGMMIWRDSASSKGCWGAIEWDEFVVTGGRLGPTEEHNLYDIPHCYVRDCLMASTLFNVDPSIRSQVQEALFPDLTSSEREEYSAIIEEIEHPPEVPKTAKVKKPRRSREVSLTEADRVRDIQLTRKITTQEAGCIMKEEKLLDTVDDTIDLSPDPSFAALKLKVTDSDSPSGRWGAARENDKVSVPHDCVIDRNCDQVRAMIKILVRKGHLGTNDLIRALDGGQVRHPQLIKFLEQHGPLEGKQSKAFQQIWHFFKKRELLGIELTAPQPKSGPTIPREVRELIKLREVDPYRGVKRPSQWSSGKSSKSRKTL